MTKLIDTIPQTHIAPSAIHGNGLFANVGFENNQRLGGLDGQAIRHADHPEAFDMEWNALSEEVLLVRGLKTKYALMNHSTIPSCYIDEDQRTIRAARDIQPGEELTLDYTAQPLPPEYLALERASYLRRGDDR